MRVLIVELRNEKELVMSHIQHGVSVRIPVLVFACFALLASCASEGGGATYGGSGSFARGGHSSGPGGGPSRGLGGAPGGAPGGERRDASAAKASDATMLARSQSIAVDCAGNVYLADSSGNRIQRIDAAGTTTTVAGNGNKGYAGDGGPAATAQLSSPCAVAVDSSGNIYVADSSNNRVRKIDAAGIISTIAGDGKKGYGGDCGPATSAQLSAPTGLAIDGKGNLYIFDSGNGRLRRVAVEGTITTIVGVRVDSPNGTPEGARIQ